MSKETFSFRSNFSASSRHAMKPPQQNLVVPTAKGTPNQELLVMIKRMARRAGIECGWCEHCGEVGCSEFEMHKFRRTCITSWLREPIHVRSWSMPAAPIWRRRCGTCDQLLLLSGLLK